MTATKPFADYVQICQDAQRRWASRSIRERLRPARSFRHLLVAHADELLAAVEADVDRPPGEVLGSDLLPLADAMKFLEKKAARLLVPRKVERAPLWLLGQRDVVHRRPWGVVGIIGTWNYPLLLNGVQILQALVAGNGVLFKPSEFGARSADVLTRLIHEAGFSRDLFQQLPATREAGPQLLDINIDYLIFTGSVGVGRQIAKRLGERMIPSTLELSGCDAMFVLADADPEFAERAAWFGVTLNRGQTCLAVKRIFVDRAVLPPFLAATKQRMDSAEPMKLVTMGQVTQADRLVADAEARGGQVLKATRCNGSTLDDRTTFPRIVLNATPEMELCQVDSFAPIAAVIPFDTIEHALAMESACPMALGASIFTRDPSAAQKLATRLRAGSVSINDLIAPTAHPATPFGGRCASGWGVTRGEEGLIAMTTTQVVSTRGGQFRPHFGGATPALIGSLRGLLSWSHAPRFADRVRGMWTTVRGMFRIG